MNTSNVKVVAKKVALASVDYVAAPLHMGMQLISNIAQLGADGIAMGEGYITEKIDNTKERSEVATSRVDNTKMRFLQTAQSLEIVQLKLQRSIDKSKHALNTIIHPPKDAQDCDVVEPEHVGVPAGYSRVIAMK